MLPAPERTCRSVVYVLDRSISMGFSGALAAARRAVLAGLRRLPADVRAEFIAHGASPAIILPTKSEALRRARRAAHAACTKHHRSAVGPAFVILVRRLRSELESSPGTRPTYDSTAWAPGKRLIWSSAAMNRNAVAAMAQCGKERLF